MKKSNELQAGVFILFATALIIVVLFTLGKERQLFADLVNLHTSFEDVQGLAEEAPVRLGGITIGRVDKIEFSDNLKDNNVHVTLLINEDFLSRVKSDSKVSIDTQGLLGDRFISISPGVSGAKLSPGAELQSYVTGDIARVLDKAGIVAEEAANISQKASKILTELEKDTIKNMSQSFKSLASITAQIEKGEGFVGRLVYDEKEGKEIIRGLAGASKSLGNVSKEIEEGKGLIHALVYEEEAGDTVRNVATASKELAETSKVIGELSRDIKNGNGLLHDLIYQKSPEGMDEIMHQLVKAAQNLEKATSALAAGGGTLGALLVDSQIYDNLVEVTDEAKRSFLLRSAIRSSLSKDDEDTDE